MELKLEAAEWKRYLAMTVRQITGDLGVNGKVAAIPYKLLLYEKGGHFLPHRECPREANFFRLRGVEVGGRLE
ncbi:hypothetical protein BH23VER1_BH23VER1_17920 [soil metagenome]